MDLAFRQNTREQNFSVLRSFETCSYLLLLSWSKCTFRLEDRLRKMRHRQHGTPNLFSEKGEALTALSG